MTRGIVKIDIGHGLPVGEGWALEVAMRDLGERLLPLPAVDYLPALRAVFRRHRLTLATCEEKANLTTLAEELHSQLRHIGDYRHAYTEEAQVVRLLNAHRKAEP